MNFWGGRNHTKNKKILSCVLLIAFLFTSLGLTPAFAETNGAYSFGSSGIRLVEGEYKITVAAMKATNINESSGLAPYVNGAATLKVDSEGKATVTVPLKKTGTHDWKIYDGQDTSGQPSAMQYDGSETTPSSISFELPAGWDGVYAKADNDDEKAAMTNAGVPQYYQARDVYLVLSYNDKTYSFGSDNVSLTPASYDITVAAMKATNINESSGLAPYVNGAATLKVDSEGKATVTVPLKKTGTHDWKIYDGQDTSGQLSAMQYDGSETTPSSISFELPAGWDGVYAKADNDDEKAAMTNAGVPQYYQARDVYFALSYGDDAGNTGGENDKTDNETSGTEEDDNNTSSGSNNPAVTSGNYYVPVELLKAGSDETSMGDSAFENNRTALAVANDSTYDIYVGANPMQIGTIYTGITDIDASDYDLEVVKTKTITATSGSQESSATIVTQFKLADVAYGTEYITITFTAVYAPMGTATARLHLDWDNATATSADSISSNTNTASGNSDILTDAVDITDNTTGIRLEAAEGVLPDGTTMTVTEITNGTKFDTAAEALAEIGETFKLYNIKVASDGSDVEPTTTVKLSFPIPNDYDSSKVAVYRINEDGTKVVLTGSVEDGKYVIETKTFGLYAVVLTDEVQETVVNTSYDAATAAVVAKYPDINNHWAAGSIAYVVNRGLMGAVAEGTFGPEVEMSRAMLVTILSRLEGINGNNYMMQSDFRDVDNNAWYAPAVQWSVSMGIVNGIGDGMFGPDTVLTREQLAVILNNYANHKNITLKSGVTVNFSDSAKVSTWAESAMNVMVQSDVVRGRTDGTLDPQGTVTRAEATAMLQRFVSAYVDVVEETTSETN